MLSGILRSDVAIQVSIRIMNTFVEMRRFIANNALLFEKVSQIELKQLEYQKSTERGLIRYFSIWRITLNQIRRYSLTVRFMMLSA